MGTSKQDGRGVDNLAAGNCAQERKDIGRSAFAKKYGSQRAMRSCIRRSRGRVKTAVTQASHACEEELSLLGWSAFVDTYGSDETGADAFAECIADELDEGLDPTAEVVGDDEVDDEGAF